MMKSTSCCSCSSGMGGSRGAVAGSMDGRRPVSGGGIVALSGRVPEMRLPSLPMRSCSRNEMSMRNCTYAQRLGMDHNSEKFVCMDWRASDASLASPE